MNIKELNGLTIVDVRGLEVGSEEIIIDAQKNASCMVRSFRMYHPQDCCENVQVSDIDGDASELIGGLVTDAYESESDATGEPGIYESGTWTFYTINTTKGRVWIRWLGESNGYYGEGVYITEIDKE